MKPEAASSSSAEPREASPRAVSEPDRPRRRYRTARLFRRTAKSTLSAAHNQTQTASKTVLQAVPFYQLATALTSLVPETVSPTSFHQVTAALAMTPSKPLTLRLSFLALSYVLVLMQVVVVTGVVTGSATAACVSNADCVAGFWCNLDKTQCDICIDDVCSGGRSFANQTRFEDEELFYRCGEHRDAC